MEHFRYLSPNRLGQLPKAPGVYAFLKGKQILYIGKAASIKDRVKSHFALQSWRDTLFMNEVEKVGWRKCESDIDALLAESQLIKKVQPKYNVMWKDDKSYLYVRISKHPLPAVSLTHRPSPKEDRNNKQAEYIGPFIESKSIRRVLSLLRRTFPFYTTERHPKTSCQYCQLNLCPGPNPDEKKYRKDIKNLTAVLKGKRTAVATKLEREMKLAARREDFERAASLRDQFFSLNRVVSHAKLLARYPENELPWEGTELHLQNLLKTNKHLPLIEAYDISNIQGKEATGSQVVFHKGVPTKERYRKYKIKIAGTPNDFAMMQELVTRRLQHAEWPYPQVMVIDGGKGQLSSARKALEESGVKTIILTSLAKREEELFVEGKTGSVKLRDLPRPVENLFIHIRDEAHRFALAYHRKLREKALGLTKSHRAGRIQ